MNIKMFNQILNLTKNTVYVVAEIHIEDNTRPYVDMLRGFLHGIPFPLLQRLSRALYDYIDIVWVDAYNANLSKICTLFIKKESDAYELGMFFLFVDDLKETALFQEIAEIREEIELHINRRLRLFEKSLTLLPLPMQIVELIFDKTPTGWVLAACNADTDLSQGLPLHLMRFHVIQDTFYSVEYAHHHFPALTNAKRVTARIETNGSAIEAISVF